MRSSADRAGGRRRRVEPALLVTVALTLAALLFFDRPLAVGDGLAYLIWLDSIALDGDLDLSNQAAKFGALNTYHIYREERTGKWASAFPFGIGLLLTPFYWAGAALDRLPAFRVNDAHFLGIQGVPFAYSLCAMIGVNLLALWTVILAYRIARRFAAPWAAAGATVATFVGTPLLFYSSVDPLNSHIGGAFAATAFVLLWLRARDGLKAGIQEAGSADLVHPGHGRGACVQQPVLSWFGLGLVGGLVALCRWQVSLIAIPPVVELLFSRRWREVLAMALGFSLLAWLIPFSWWQMFGSPVVLPASQGDSNIAMIAPVHTLDVLLSPIAGLLPWSPIVALALVGLWPLARRDRALAWSGLAMFVLQALICGMVRDWWAGIGFGMRRMAELYPLYTLFLAVLVSSASWRRWLIGPVWALTAVLAAYGIALVLARLNFTWTNPWGLARDTPLKELRYTFSRQHWPVMWPVIRDHVGPWAWKRPGP